jgi:DNA invertase Pin-like site-specific DNA recombinase
MKYFVYCRKSSESEDRQVLSIESQKSELLDSFAKRADVQIIQIFEEARSAKEPGRPIFNGMLSRLEKGEAQGIICWKLDRLARNPVDEGRIKWLLQTEVIKNIKTADREYYPDDNVLITSVEFGVANQYIRDLSRNVKRGFRAKLTNGWLPSQAPLGYCNDKETKTIVQVPGDAKIVRQLFQLYLTERHSLKAIATIARDQWDFQTPVRRGKGGTPLSVSQVHKILSNPFYAGTIVWRGELYPGKHVPLVSPSEFSRVQNLLGRRDIPRPKSSTFTYRGLCRCGGCGRQLTAEKKVNRYGYRYTYYHCSRNQFISSCSERSIEEGDLETQIGGTLARLTIPKAIGEWLVAALSRRREDLARLLAENVRQIDSKISDARRQIEVLVDMRVRELVSDEDFVSKRKSLQESIYRLEESLRDPRSPITTIEPLSRLISFGSSLFLAFEKACGDKRRAIVEIVVSNLVIRDRKLIFEAAVPFAVATGNGGLCARLGIPEDVRTLCQHDTCSRPTGDVNDEVSCLSGIHDLEKIVERLIDYAVNNREDLERRVHLLQLLNEPAAAHYELPSRSRPSVKSIRSLMTQSLRATSRTSASSKERANSRSKISFSEAKSSGRRDDMRSSQSMQQP